jgi:ribonucleotide monophosphatase NagD (HAD superfamily)
VEGGYIPDAGAILAAISASTGVRPAVVVGKPNPLIVEEAARRLRLPLAQVAVVGDRLYTDIESGKRAGIPAILVLTGETQLSDLEGSATQPDYVFSSLGALAEVLER